MNMSSTRAQTLFYESAAALRLVDRELESLRDIAWPVSTDSEARLAPAASTGEAARGDAGDEVAHYDRSELLAGLDRVSRLLNDVHPAAANLPTQSA
jgi:hypothetical protein